MTQQQGYTHPEFITDTAWLGEHLEDANLRVVDTDVVAAYQRGHIPGAVMIPDNFEKDPDTNRVNILPPAKFAAMMEELGIGDDTLVVTYDNSGGVYGGRLWWALNYYGHTNVKFLNGGWRKWVNEGRPISLKPGQARSGVHFTARADPSLIITTDQLKEEYNKPDVVVWDVRSRGEYTGEAVRGNKRPGHIAGAAYMEWLDLTDQETHELKPAAEMRRLLESKGITPDKRIAPH